MRINGKAEFAVKILLEYANENGINGRDTTDLSPLEKWLILRLYNVEERNKQLCECKYPIIRTGVVEYCSVCQLEVG